MRVLAITDQSFSKPYVLLSGKVPQDKGPLPLLDQVAAGLAWETIIEEWRGSITQEAITEAVRLARQALLEHVAEYVVGPTAA